MGPVDEGAKPARTFHVVLDEPAGKDAQFLVDANGNGDLTDDPAVEWKKKAYKGQDDKDYSQYNGGATVELKYANSVLPAHLGMYRFDPNEPARASMKDVVLFYADYAYQGELTLGERKLKVMLVDDSASGDFRGKEGGKDSGVRLLVDANGNGKFEARGEAFDVRKPFNLGRHDLRTLRLGGFGGWSQTRQVLQDGRGNPAAAGPRRRQEDHPFHGHHDRRQEDLVPHEFQGQDRHDRLLGHMVHALHERDAQPGRELRAVPQAGL
jgi:hypothetical protein